MIWIKLTTLVLVSIVSIGIGCLTGMIVQGMIDYKCYKGKREDKDVQ